MGEPGDRDRFPAEPGDELGVGGQVRVQQLHGHPAGEHLVDRFPHRRHAAAGDAVLEPVAAADQLAGRLLVGHYRGSW
jgi:hypothetical protein